MAPVIRSLDLPTEPHNVPPQPRIMTPDRRTWIEPLLLALVLALWFGYELGGRALWSPDEGRYAEIPREMLASGDYLTPRLNGVKYFEKPPLMYWLVAGAIKTIGLNEWAARLWPALFALGGCLVLYFVGRELYGSRVALYAAVIAATSPLYDFMGGILTLDMALSTALTAALGLFLLAARAPPGGRRRLMFYGFYACTAAAVMTKGIVGALIPAMVIGTWIVLLWNWRLLREMHLPTGLLVFFLLVVPWHVLVWRANPEFGWFYFVHEHFERYLTTVHQRYEPVWFFIPVLLIGMYPWTPFLPYLLRDGARGLWRERRAHGDTWFLLLWAALPFVFFSLSSSKLIPYVLPVVPPLALLFGRWLAQRWQPELARGAFVSLLALGAVLAGALLLAPHVLSSRANVVHIAEQLGVGLYFMAGGSLLAGALPFLVRLKRDRQLTIIALFVGATIFVGSFDLNFSRLDVGRSVKALALFLKSELKPSDEVMSYDTYYQDLPVYLQRRVTVVAWKGELEFGTTVEDTRDWMIDEPEFRRRWNEPRAIYLLTDHVNYDKLRADPPGRMRLLAQTAHAVLLTNREAMP